MGIDLVTQKFGDRNPWLISLVYAVVFLVLLLAVQWPFGDFLMSEYARNWFFGTESWYFGASPDWEYRYAYGDWMVARGTDLLKGLAIALAIAYSTSRISIRWGKWMKNVMR